MLSMKKFPLSKIDVLGNNMDFYMSQSWNSKGSGNNNRQTFNIVNKIVY